mmetsp:Transcript_5366/g.9876  ORF Transcript_5366/g.9876 Transcript_5366/m.9876 type:complete len:174 (-) Transcript_5366:504-1025(-)
MFLSFIGYYYEAVDTEPLDNIAVTFNYEPRLGQCFDTMPRDTPADLTWYRSFPSIGRTHELTVSVEGTSLYSYIELIDLKMLLLKDLRNFGGQVYDGESVIQLYPCTFAERFLKLFLLGLLFLLILLVTTHAVRELFVTVKLTFKAMSSLNYRQLLCFCCVQSCLVFLSVKHT